jgi:RHS repeat-associated protein
VLAGSGAAGGGAGGALALTDAHGNQVGQFTAAGASLAGSRAYDPWGNITATAGSMTGLLGYQSAWTDAAAGKDLMGARWYDPGAGDFTSADTVAVSPDPDEAAGNPFAYAADEPLNLVDPTGHYIVPEGGAEGAGTSERIGNGATSASNYVADVTTARIVEQAVTKAPNDAAKAAAARAAVAKVEAEQATARKAAVAAAAKAARAAAAKKTAEQVAERKAAAQRSAAAARAPAFAPGCSGRMLNYGACPSEMGAAGTTSAQVGAALKSSLFIIGSAIPIPGFEEWSASEAVTDITEASDSADIGGAATDAPADEAGTGGGDDEPPCPTQGGSSFTAATLVLLASGKTVPISSLKPGDKVMAADTRTGKNQTETVTAVLLHHDTDLYNLTVKNSHGTEVIHTTASHLFWDPYLDKGWIPAKHLKPGMHLKTPDGQSAVVLGGSVPADHDGWMWDLTVPGNNDHDFYVVVTTTVAVLVHNCPTGDSGPEQTAHGAERAADPSRLDPAAQADVIANPTQTLSQADGAQVYVQQVGDRYNVVVQGERGVITNLKNISAKSFTRLARNYGWTPN